MLSGGNVGQPHHILVHRIDCGEAERRPGASEEGTAAAKHDRMKVDPIFVDQAKVGLLGDGDTPRDMALFFDACKVAVPVGIGVVVGIAGVSNAMRILLIEDDATTAAYVERALGECGYLVERVGDGRDGLFRFNANGRSDYALVIRKIGAGGAVTTADGAKI